MHLKDAIAQSHLSYRVLAGAAGMPKSVLCRIVNQGSYPSRRSVAAVQESILQALRRNGISTEKIEFPIPCDDAPRRDARYQQRNAPIPTAIIHEQSTEAIDNMKLDRTVLAHFGLRKDPFLNDVESDSDVFNCKAHNAVLQALRDAIEERAMVALVARSGSGKTTIWDSIETEFAMRDDFVLCKPAVKHKELLSPDHLAQALIYGLLGEDTHMPHGAEKRGRVLTRALQSLRTGTQDKHAVLLIDDAHYCNQSVLRQLKTFFEEKIGRYRLLAIVLIGLPELKPKLERFSEIGNRIRLCEVPPVPVEEYLAFKLKRVGSSIDKLFDAGGLAAFLDRFRKPRRPALGAPLDINVACIRAMVKLYDNGAEPGERISREIIDQLPGGAIRLDQAS